jgi:DNA modification methylase
MKLEPNNFEFQYTTVWSFPRRWKWATHDSKYRWNWSPDVVRNLILRYSEEGDLLLDPMVWWWTTAIECKLLNRNLICWDINPEAVKLTKEKLNFKLNWKSEPKIEVKQIDARNLNFISDESIDFILTHPPYWNIIKYSKDIKWDLSLIKDLNQFYEEIWKIAIQFYRVLKRWKYCAILIWDTRKNKFYVPIAFNVMQKFLDVWFKLKEDIVKIQHNCRATWFWKKRSKEYNFLLIMHEHLFIFQKT